MKKNIFYVVIILIIVSINLQAQLVGHWSFDDSNDLQKAEVGKPLLLIGNAKAVAGPEEGNGAVRIGVGSYFKLDHGLPASKGQEKVNEFSFVFDVKIPKTSKWYSLFQTDLTNKEADACYIGDRGNIGINGSNYAPTELKANEWYRIGISANKSDQRYYYYIDGFRVYEGLARYAKYFDVNGILLFADNSGRDNEFDVADVKLFSNALSDKEMKELGGYHDKPTLKIAEPDSVIHPYLQTPTESSIYVCWHASNSPKSVVRYGKTKKLGNSEIGDVHIWGDSTTWHWVKLKNLEPETVYYYQAISDTMKSAIYKFKTPPRVGEKKGHIRFAIIGDTRTFPNQFRSVVTSLKEKVIELYGDNEIENTLNLVLCNGDIVHYGPTLAQYKPQWFEPLESISANVPIMVSIGDHEHEADNYYNYMKQEDIAGPEKEKYYSFKYGRVLFVSVNSIYHSKKQLEWFDNLLSDAEEDSRIDWVIVYTHRPGHTENYPHGGERYVQDHIIPIMSKYSKTEILTYGHSHAYERGQVTDANFRLLQNGGGGAELGRWKFDQNQRDYPEIQRTNDYWSYSIVDIDVANKKYEAKSFSLGNSDRIMNNELFDSFFRDKGNETPPQKPVGKTKGSVAIPIKLSASAYSGVYEILSSQFQVTNKKGDYSSLIVDSKRDFENVYSDSGAPDFIPIDKNAGIDLTKLTLENNKLETGKTYWWRVRYRDKNLQWSDWSDEVSVTVENK